MKLLSQRLSTAAGPLAVIGGIGLVVLLVPVLKLLGGSAGTIGPSVPLLFLAPVLIASTVGGRVSGAVVAVVAVAAWDWFFIPPFYTVTVNYSRDVLALVIFVGVALLTGQLADSARQRAEDALRRAAVAQALYDLSTALIGSHDVQEVLRSLTASLYSVFRLRACAVLLPSGNTWATAAASGNLPPELTVEKNRAACSVASWVAANNQASGLPAARARFLPLQARDRAVGVLEIVFRSEAGLDEERERLISTFANSAALVVEQARLAQEERAAAIARESDELKSALLSSVSHDLRTPLAGIKAAASSLLQQDIQWSEEDRLAFATDIDREADRLTRLVSDLLDLSRIEAGVLKPVKQNEDIEELIVRTVDRVQPRLGGRLVEIHVQQGLPLVPMDVVQVEQVLVNLLDNAGKYAPSGTPIEVSAELVDLEGNREVRVSVSDRGPGVPERDRSQVFDKFHRLPGSGSRQGGTGLGLAIVKGLVEAHGGHVWIEAGEEGGARFVFSLPTLDQEVVTEQQVEEEAAP